VVVAVAGLVLVEQFLNTLDERSFRRYGKDHAAADELTSVQALATWLQWHGLVTAGHEPGPSDLAAARTLRRALRLTLTGDADGEGSRAVDALAGFPLRLLPDYAGGLRLAAADGTAGLGAVVEAVALAVADGRWSRLKLCAAPDCRWAFYDTSRNGGGRWCSMEVCGNRHKTRTYRQRRVS
jgi:predicted RNA-binding Zn ribbon-like protein